jgi:two-component system OmpR family response regulator
MNAEQMTVSIDGEDVPVTVREFNILFKLLSYPKKAFSRSQIMEEFWDADSDATLRAV